MLTNDMQKELLRANIKSNDILKLKIVKIIKLVNSITLEKLFLSKINGNEIIVKYGNISYIPRKNRLEYEYNGQWFKVNVTIAELKEMTKSFYIFQTKKEFKIFKNKYILITTLLIIIIFLFLNIL